MVVGTLVVDVMLGDVGSLKQKRSVVRPLVAELRRRFEVAAAETGHLDLHRRAEVVGGRRQLDPRARASRCSTAASGWWPITASSRCCRRRQRVLDDDDLD